MTDERMTAGAVAQAEPIHHNTVFGPEGYAAPTTCGRTEQPKPAASDWKLVTCPACLAKAPDVTYSRTSLEDQVGRPCSCARCEADGQHEPMCSVHLRDAEDRQGACDCVRRT